MRFLDPQHGWAVGGVLLYTADGGQTWKTQTAATGQNLLGVDFVDVNTGWAVGGNGTPLHTANGGATWTPQKSNPTAFLESVSFVNASEGWAVGSAYPVAEILHSTDGGNTWVPGRVPTPVSIRSSTLTRWMAGRPARRASC